jgi:hypothetical protein
VPTFVSQLWRYDVQWTGDNAIVEAHETGWYRVRLTGPWGISLYVVWTRKSKRGAEVATWVQWWRPMAGRPVTGPIVDGASLRWDGTIPAAAYQSTGAPCFETDFYLDRGDQLFFDTQLHVSAVTVDFMGFRERSTIDDPGSDERSGHPLGLASGSKGPQEREL